MSEIQKQVKDLRELRRMADELAAEIEAIQDSLKAIMTTQGVDEITGTDFKITWKNVTSNRLDTAALRKSLPDVAQAFTKQTTSRRFVVA